MRLQNGYELDGKISYASILLNDEYTEILIIETTMGESEARGIFMSNNIITNVTGDIISTYHTKGLIDVKKENDKSYVWLYFDYSFDNDSNDQIKLQITNILKSMIQ